jgi:hypothetical protein
MKRTKIGRIVLYIFAVMTMGILQGCPSASVNATRFPLVPPPRPDMIVVYDFAVTPEEVKLDQGLMKKALRDDSLRALTEEEIKVDHAVADKLAESLVSEFRKAGIASVRAGGVAQPTSISILLTGQFITIDQGNQTARNMIGFGLGGTELRTRIQAYQGGELITEAETATKSSLKPGMLVSGGVSAAANSVVPLVVGGTGAVISESWRGTIEADAARTAEEVAKRVKKVYEARGWLP